MGQIENVEKDKEKIQTLQGSGYVCARVHVYGYVWNKVSLCLNTVIPSILDPPHL